MAGRSIKQFYYIIIDDDQKLFNYFGPISNDNDWNWKVVDAQKGGRNMRARTPWTDEELAQSISILKRQGYQHTDELLVNAPPDRSAEFSGSLPDYAKSADRNRVVRFLCRNCGVARYGEMNVRYPGKEILHKSDLGAYSARCLKCGTVAYDPYNWFR
jgi:predicted nucleic-acid-binding Zn-ribbon protein